MPDFSALEDVVLQQRLAADLPEEEEATGTYLVMVYIVLSCGIMYCVLTLY